MKKRKNFLPFNAILEVTYKHTERSDTMEFNEEIMWNAVVGCDEAYDGKFFYGVQTVGVYCKPSCKSRTPLRKNVRFFETGREAEEAGFRPCKRCNPNLIDYAPMLELARQTKELIDVYFCERKKLWAKMEQLGVSPSHLSVVFKHQYGVRPANYLNQKRAEYAKRMLAETNMSIIDVAGDIGFESLSGFYTFFRKYTGTTPKNYRENLRKPGEEM